MRARSVEVLVAPEPRWCLREHRAVTSGDGSGAERTYAIWVELADVRRA